MLDYMDYVQQCFDAAGRWKRQNSYGEVTQTPKNLIDFKIPDAVNLQVSNRSTKYSYNSLQLSTRQSINGSLTYLYTNLDAVEGLVKNTEELPLHDIVQTYELPAVTHHRKEKTNFHKCSLYYGKIFYPSSDVEAMMIKRFSPMNQVIVKCLSSLKENVNIFTAYFQRNSEKNFQELIVSSNDLLCGYRISHHFLRTPSKLNSSLYNNSSLFFGAEFWLGMISLNPGCSTSLKYCTHSANTGRPLTLTLSWNPLFGHISTTYSAMTSSSSTFCAKYDFNIYSIESNLSFGIELWRKTGALFKSEDSVEANRKEYEQNFYISHDHNLLPSKYGYDHEYNISDGKLSKEHKRNKIIKDLNHAFSTSLQKIDKEKTRIENFGNIIRNSHFTSVFKASTSLRERNLKFLWEGEYKNFLLSAGTELRVLKAEESELRRTSGQSSNSLLNEFSLQPLKFGVQIQFSS
ncbi:Mitochondrial distribution and morphology protein 10 [Nakaseomyces glabratus]